MKNRNVEFFNLSFLDLLSGALASIIFLFIIVPKGELTINSDPVIVVYDSIQNKFYGSVPADFGKMGRGDTVLAIVGGLEGIPIAMEEVKPATPDEPESLTQRPRKKVQESKDSPKAEETPKKQVASTPVEPKKLIGSRPDVPCVVSFEIRWANKKDNVDLYVCKDNACVFGGTRGSRSIDFIGFWDSGKSRTKLFGQTDLRTNQEAVRQFDNIIPGTYDIYAQYKESSEPKTSLPIRFQVYTINEDNLERGDDEYFKLKLNPVQGQKTRIARVVIGPKGEIEFQTFK